MRAGGGNLKGGQFERDISVALSKWISHGKDIDLFWRSAMSGGRATVLNRKRKGTIRQLGDIVAESSEGNILTDSFVIECKSYKDLHFNSLLFGKPKNNSISGFWKMLVKLADDNNKYPMLIAKQNNKPIIMCLTIIGYRKLLCNGHSMHYRDRRVIAIYKRLNAILLDFEATLNETWTL